MPRSPLAQLLHDINAAGTSYREMERIALAHGIRYSSSSFEQVAKDERRSRLDVDAIRAIAVVTGRSAVEIAVLDDERWGLSHRRSSGPSEADVVDWLREHLPAHLGEHIVTQYFILKAAARSGASPPDPQQASHARAGVREAPNGDPDDDPDQRSPVHV